MTTDETYKRDIKQMHRLAKKITLILLKVDPEVQGAVLAELYALWIASYFDPTAPDLARNRKELMKMWFKGVQEMIPIMDQRFAVYEKALH